MSASLFLPLGRRASSPPGGLEALLPSVEGWKPSLPGRLPSAQAGHLHSQKIQRSSISPRSNTYYRLTPRAATSYK